MAARPVVLPEPYNGESRWDEWISHFEDVAAVNTWDAGAKLLWLRVRLTGKARTAYQRIADVTDAPTYNNMKTALTKRFDPESKRELYLAEMQARMRRTGEGWADYADELRSLADKAYPDLQVEAREQIALTHFLSQLTNQQISFSVKQSRPKTVDDAVSATLQMEAYLKTNNRVPMSRIVPKFPHPQHPEPKLQPPPPQTKQMRYWTSSNN